MYESKILWRQQKVKLVGESLKKISVFQRTFKSLTVHSKWISFEGLSKGNLLNSWVGVKLEWNFEVEAVENYLW